MAFPPEVFYLHLAETRSTMLRVRQADLLSRPEEFVLVQADAQTEGRGQHGTSWESSPGKNLLFSLLCRPTFLAPEAQFRLSEVAALATLEALRPYVAARVKWPNDVYVGDRKICGMLLEHDLSASRIVRSVVGPGINVNQRVFRGDAPNPVSLRQLLGHDVALVPLLEAWTSAFIRLYRRLAEGEAAAIDRAYRAALYRRTGYHSYRDAAGPFSARIVGVEPSGRLLLQDADGRLRRYAFKEVSYVLPAKL